MCRLSASLTASEPLHCNWYTIARYLNTILQLFLIKINTYFSENASASGGLRPPGPPTGALPLDATGDSP